MRARSAAPTDPAPEAALSDLYGGLKNAVRELLQGITDAASPSRALYGPPRWAALYSNDRPRFRLVVGAAPGADHAVMETVKSESLRAQNWDIDVILPWQKTNFIKDANEDLEQNNQVAIRQEAWDGLFESTNILELPGLDRRKVAKPDGRAATDDRTQHGTQAESGNEAQKIKDNLVDQLSFAAAADFFLRQVDVLIAILGPDAGPKPAGTAAIADRAVQNQIPVIRINPAEAGLVPTEYFGRAQAAKSTDSRIGKCGIIRIVDGLMEMPGAESKEQRRRFAIHVASASDVSNFRVLRERDTRDQTGEGRAQAAQDNTKKSGLRRATEAALKFLGHIWPSARHQEHGSMTGSERLAVTRDAAHARMVSFQRTQCWVLISLPLILAAAAALAIVGLALPQIIEAESAKRLKPWLVGGEIIAFLAAAGMFVWAAQSQIHLRFLEISALHESLRQAQLLEPLADHEPIRTSVGQALSWREWYLRATVRALPLPVGFLGRERQREILRYLKQSEVIERRTKLERLRDYEDGWERRLRDLATRLFWVGLAFAAALLAFLSIIKPPADWLVGAMALLIALLPVGGGAILAIRHGLDFQGRAKIAGDALKAIARLEPTFDFHDDYPTFDVTRKLLREALGVATADLDDFLVQEALREFELSP